MKPIFTNVKGIPRTEQLWVTIHKLDVKYFITSKINDTSLFYLYKYNDNEHKAVKIDKDKNPKNMEKRHDL